MHKLFFALLMIISPVILQAGDKKKPKPQPKSNSNTAAKKDKSLRDYELDYSKYLENRATQSKRPESRQGWKKAAEDFKRKRNL